MVGKQMIVPFRCVGLFVSSSRLSNFFAIQMDDPSITHHISDRPQLPSSYSSLPKHREFVQPQWIVDSANNTFLLPISKYAVGQTLPPHLSPWVDHEEEGYKPKYAEEIEKIKNGETFTEMETEPVEEFVEKMDQIDDGEADVAEADDAMDADEEEEDDEETEKEKQEKARAKREEEEQRLAKSMMSRKASHLYQRMQNGIAKKQAKVDTLHNRRKELDRKAALDERAEIKGKKKSETGKTPLKLKVERLKGERKKVEDTYSNVDLAKKSKKRRP